MKCDVKVVVEWPFILITAFLLFYDLTYFWGWMAFWAVVVAINVFVAYKRAKKNP